MDYFRKFAWSEWLGRNQELTYREKALWMYLNERQGNRTHAWPSQIDILDGLGWTDARELRRVLKSLKDKMYVVTRRMGVAKQGKGQNVYAVCIPAEWERVSETVASLRGRNTLSAQGVRDPHAQGVGHPKPSFNRTSQGTAQASEDAVAISDEDIDSFINPVV